MNPCETFIRHLDGWLDETLEPEYRAEIGEHLDQCAACRQTLERAAAIERRIRAEASTWTAPDGLWRRIRSGAGSSTPRFSARPRLAGMAAAIAIFAIALAAYLSSSPPRSGDFESTAAALVNEFHTFVVSRRELDHREPRPDSLRDWFGDKVEFRVPLPASAPGFMLAGGRLCNMFDQRIVSYMYEVDGAWVSLYVMQSAHGRKRPAPVRQLLVNGYGYVEWQRQGLHYSLVGDLPAERLRAIAERLAFDDAGVDRRSPRPRSSAVRI